MLIFRHAINYYFEVSKYIDSTKVNIQELKVAESHYKHNGFLSAATKYYSIYLKLIKIRRLVMKKIEDANFDKNTVKLCVLLLIFIFVLNGFASAQEKDVSLKPFDLDQIIKLLMEKIDEAEIIKQVKKYKVNFEYTRDVERKLIRAGASDDLLDTIKMSYIGKKEDSLVITFPRNDEECGAVVRVEGISKKYPNRFLWVFAHRVDLTDQWWPQTSTVNVNDDGSWIIGANLGGPQDIGFPFEIVAMWVNESVHKKMKNYISTGASTNHYPPIQLPKGELTTKVKVRKVRH